MITNIGTAMARKATPITSSVLGALSFMAKSYSFDFSNNRIRLPLVRPAENSEDRVVMALLRA